MKLNSKKIASAILVSLSLYACTEDYFEFDKVVLDELRPEYAIPLINSSLSMEDILMNEDTAGLVITGSDGVLEILYEGNVVSSLGNSSVPIPDVLENSNINGIPSPPPTTQATVPLSDTLEIALGNGIEGDSILLKSGKLALNFSSTVRHPVDITINFTGFKDENNVTLTKTFAIPPYNGITPSVRASIDDLEDYLIDLSLKGTDVNKIPIEMVATITGAAGVPPGTTGNIQLTSNLRNLELKEFYGYFGQSQIDLKEDTVLIALFKNFDRGRFYVSDPVLDITISNGYGMPISLGFNYLDAITPNRTVPKKAINLGPNNPVSLLYPSGHGVEKTNVRLNKDNSNIPEIISDLVKQIAFKAVANPNPTGRIPGVTNFISDTSGIGLDVKLRVPLAGFASGFTMEDTLDFEFEGADNIESGLIRTRVSNGFPLEGKLQLFFTDGQYNKLDSLFMNGQQIIIPAAPVGGDGKATSIAEATTDATLTKERLKKLVDSKFILLKAELETTNGSNAIPDTVKFLPSYKLDIAIGIKASILID